MLSSELNITAYFHHGHHCIISASQAELGVNAGQITWNNAKTATTPFGMLDTDEKKDAFRKFVRSSGGWNDEEVAAFSDTDLNALLLQWISGDIREAGLDVEEPDWDAYEKDEQVVHRIYLADDGEVYFDIGE